MPLEIELGVGKIEAAAGLHVVRNGRTGNVHTREAVGDVAVDVASLHEATHLKAEPTVNRLHEEAVVPTRCEFIRLKRCARPAVGKHIFNDRSDVCGARLCEPSFAARLAKLRDLGRERSVRRLEPLNAAEQRSSAVACGHIRCAYGSGNSQCRQHQRREQRARRTEKCANGGARPVRHGRHPAFLLRSGVSAPVSGYRWRSLTHARICRAIFGAVRTNGARMAANCGGMPARDRRKTKIGRPLRGGRLSRV